MCSKSPGKPSFCKIQIRYVDYLAEQWVRLHAPLRWCGNVDLWFRTIRYSQLETAGNRKNPEVITKWLRKLKTGQRIPPLIVCKTEHETFYLHDGNHRYEALHGILGLDAANLQVRVLEVSPKPGLQFCYRWYQNYSTYVLESVKPPRPSLRDIPIHGIGRSRSTWRVSQRPEGASFRLFGHVLALVAHPDDEAACATLLQRAAEPAVVFCTDGAPRSRFFWNRYGSRQRYAEVRHSEARKALKLIGVTAIHFLQDPAAQHAFVDQELYSNLLQAWEALLLLITAETPPEAIVAPAYEGGHPDHDACSLLAHLLGLERNIPVWEMPLYHRSPAGRLVHQQFLNLNGTELVLHSTAAELSMRGQMLATYASQPDAPEFVGAAVERFRPQPTYDYSLPPHPRPLNYEVWKWPMTGAKVCRAFQACLDEVHAKRQTPLLTRRQTIKTN